MEWSATFGGQTVIWTERGIFPQQNDGETAVFSAWQACPALVANACIRVDFDGLVRIDLSLMTTPGQTGNLIGLHSVMLPYRFFLFLRSLGFSILLFSRPNASAHRYETKINGRTKVLCIRRILPWKAAFGIRWSE